MAQLPRDMGGRAQGLPTAGARSRGAADAAYFAVCAGGPPTGRSSPRRGGSRTNHVTIRHYGAGRPTRSYTDSRTVRARRHAVDVYNAPHDALEARRRRARRRRKDLEPPRRPRSRSRAPLGVLPRRNGDVLRLTRVWRPSVGLRAKLASGLIPPNDLSSAEAQVAHQRLLALEAATQRGIAEDDLVRLTGNDAATATDRPDSRPAPPAAGVADLVAAALKARPERQALEQRAAGAEARRRRRRVGAAADCDRRGI